MGTIWAPVIIFHCTHVQEFCRLLWHCTVFLDQRLFSWVSHGSYSMNTMPQTLKFSDSLFVDLSCKSNSTAAFFLFNFVSSHLNWTASFHCFLSISTVMQWLRPFVFDVPFVCPSEKETLNFRLFHQVLFMAETAVAYVQRKLNENFF